MPVQHRLPTLLGGCGAAAAAVLIAAAGAAAQPPVTSAIDFQLPSGNIGCRVTATDAVCLIHTYTYSPPRRPADCHAAWGDEIAMHVGQLAHFACHSDLPVDSSAPQLPYGGVQQAGKLVCHSTIDYASCDDTSDKHGFQLARGFFTIY
jgi:hypothetical protein